LDEQLNRVLDIAPETYNRVENETGALLLITLQITSVFFMAGRRLVGKTLA
jgi:hypothetical protein